MEHILLLHGATGAKDQLQPLADNLKDHFIVHTLNFSGHGGEPFPVKSFSIELFSENVLEYMNRNAIPFAIVFGYSMGGYVGAYLAKHHPAKITRLITLGTKFHWDEVIAANEIKMLNPAKIREKIPAFAVQLDQRHSPGDWTLVLEKTKDMLIELGKDNTLKPEDYTQIDIPCLVMLGDRDKMVTMDETLNVYKNLPKGQLAILPGTPHPLEQSDVLLLASLIHRFSIN